jgi:hypothetical protein
MNIEICAFSLSLSLSSYDRRPYWRSHINPEITQAIVQALPKTDLHCNLDGCVSVSWIWNQLQKEKIDLKKMFDITCNSQEVLYWEEGFLFLFWLFHSSIFFSSLYL